MKVRSVSLLGTPVCVAALALLCLLFPPMRAGRRLDGFFLGRAARWYRSGFLRTPEAVSCRRSYSLQVVTTGPTSSSRFAMT